MGIVCWLAAKRKGRRGPPMMKCLACAALLPARVPCWHHVSDMGFKDGIRCAGCLETVACEHHRFLCCIWFSCNRHRCGHRLQVRRCNLHDADGASCTVSVPFAACWLLASAGGLRCKTLDSRRCDFVCRALIRVSFVLESKRQDCQPRRISRHRENPVRTTSALRSHSARLGRPHLCPLIPKGTSSQ